MKILVLNCGSSSIKYKLFNLEKEKVLVNGIIEKIGLKHSQLKHERPGSEKLKISIDIKDHQAGIEKILALLIDKEYGCLLNLNEIKAVGHRVVHGGEEFNSSVLITDEVINKMEECIDLAPCIILQISLGLTR